MLNEKQLIVALENWELIQLESILQRWTKHKSVNDLNNINKKTWLMPIIHFRDQIDIFF